MSVQGPRTVWDRTGEGDPPPGTKPPHRGGLAAASWWRRQSGSAHAVLAGQRVRLCDAGWPEGRVVRLASDVDGVASITVNVDGANSVTSRRVLAGIGGAWPVPGGTCYVDFKADADGTAQAFVSPGQAALEWTEGQFLTLPPAGTYDLATGTLAVPVPALCQVIDVQVTRGSLAVTAGGALVVAPGLVRVAPAHVALVSLAGCDAMMLFRCLG